MRSTKSLNKLEKFFRLQKWLIIDAVVILGAYTLAYFARSLTTPLEYAGAFFFILIAISITTTCLFINKVYHTYWPGASGHDIVILLRSILWATSITLLIDFALRPRPLPISVICLAAVLSFGGLVIVRYRSRLIGAAEWRWRAIWLHEFPDDDRERVLIVGAGESGQMTVRRLREHVGGTGYKVVGFVDDDPLKQDLIVQSAKVLGQTSDIPIIAEAHRIDLIVIAIHNIDGPPFRRIVELCENTAARVKVVPDMLKLFDSKINQSFLRNIKPEDLIGRKIVARDENVDLSVISNRIVMVTGAAGSIGSELARQILHYHHPSQLIILDNNESALFELELELRTIDEDAHITPALVDITQYDAVHSVFADFYPQIVFHAAAYKHVPMLEKYPNQAVRVNIGGTLNLAEAAIVNHTERFVLISTDKAVNPTSIMGASKRICELLIHALAERDYHHTMFTAVRFGNVLGSRGSVVPIFNRQIDAGGPITVTDEKMTRYFMSISEAVNLVIHAAALTNGDDIFVLRMGEVVRIMDLAKRMIRLRGLRPDVDIDIVITGKRPGEKYTEQLIDHFEQLDNTIHPGIIKMVNSTMNGHNRNFIDSVYELVRNGLPEDEEPLMALTAISGVNYDLNMSAD